MERLAGIVLIAGSLLFLIAAFMPISMRVFPESDPQRRVEIIEADRTGWNVSSTLFGAGSVVTVIGLLLFALHVQSASDNATLKLASILAVIAAAVGAALWVIVVYGRITMSAQEWVSGVNVNTWMFPTYMILTQLAWIVIGYTLAQTGYPGWLGWGMAGLSALSLVAFLILKDLPPFTHYVMTVIMGVVLALR